jgi:hypothetical protein
MSNNAFYGAVLVLTDASNAQEIAERVASAYFPESEYHFKVTESTPDHLPEQRFNQIEDELKFVPEGSVVLTVYPYAATSL